MIIIAILPVIFGFIILGIFLVAKKRVLKEIENDNEEFEQLAAEYEKIRQKYSSITK